MKKDISIENETILDFAEDGNLKIAVESFVTDRKASGRSDNTIRYYLNYLDQFVEYSTAQSVTKIRQISPDFIRRYLLTNQEKWNPGGMNACFRTLRVFFRWLDFEDVMDPNWKNPIAKVKAPKVPQEPINPIPLEDVLALVDACSINDSFGLRDKAIFLSLLDTGVRAQELCNINIADVDLNNGAILVRKGKGRKPRTVFIGKKTRRAVRAYLRNRNDKSLPLFVSKTGERLTYDGLNQILERRTKKARLEEKPNLHDFRRAFAINMLRNGVNIFALQKLMGHSDLTVLRRYLAQTEADIEEAHMLGSPVDKSL